MKTATAQQLAELAESLADKNEQLQARVQQMTEMYDNTTSDCAVMRDRWNKSEARVKELEALVAKQREDLDGRMERNGWYITENEKLRKGLEKIEPMLISYADALPKDVEEFAKRGDWVCEVIMVARKALACVAKGSGG